MVIAVAIDESIDEVRVLADGITYPVLMDPDHLLTEMYAISNVPAVIWIDEQGRIARPNANEFGSDMFSEFTGRTCEGHFNQVRAWVHEGVVPDDADSEIADLDDDEVAARLHFRLAQDGLDEVVRRRFPPSRGLRQPDVLALTVDE